MGLFDNIRGAVNMAKEGIAEAKAGSDAQAEAERNGPIDILNPTAQDEVDRLNAAGGVERAVLVSASHQMLEPGEQVAKMAVTMVVRARLGEGELGTATTVKVWIGSRLAAKLKRGLELPASIDLATGLVTAVDGKALAGELQ